MNSLPFLGRRPKRFPRIPVMRLPARFRDAYAAALKSQIVDKWRAAFEATILPVLPKIERAVGLDRPGGMREDSVRLDDWADDVTRHLNQLSDDYDTIAKQARDIAAGTFDEVNTFSHRKWYDIAKKVVGVELFQHEPWIAAESKAFIHENVDLITKCKADVISDISRIIMGGFRAGKRYETIADEILTGTAMGPGVFNKTSTRAKLIARDQTSKLYGDIAEKRQTGAGLDMYVWRSLEDERVVGTPGGRYPNPTKGHGNHFFMDGKVCLWSNPNVYAENVKEAMAGYWKARPANVKGAKPGDQYSCRCYAEPVFETLFDEKRTDSIRIDAAAAWIGFDVDGTLAYYDFKVKGLRPVGKPIPRMVAFLNEQIRLGRRCKYFTARAGTEEGRSDMEAWITEYKMPRLEITDRKDHNMIICYDDRARQVIPNTGEVVHADSDSIRSDEYNPDDGAH